MEKVGCIDVVMKEVIKTILGYISIRFYFEEFKKKKRTQREGERNNLGTGAVKVRREVEDTMFAFRQQVHLAS